MAKKPNYNFEKRRKELEKKLKREEKERRKREHTTREDEAPASPAPGEAPAQGTPE